MKNYWMNANGMKDLLTQMHKENTAVKVSSGAAKWMALKDKQHWAAQACLFKYFNKSNIPNGKMLIEKLKYSAHICLISCVLFAQAIEA